MGNLAARFRPFDPVDVARLQFDYPALTPDNDELPQEAEDHGGDPKIYPKTKPY